MDSRRINCRWKLALAVAMTWFTAAPARPESLITTSTTSGVFNAASKFYSHCVDGYYWVALRNGSSIDLFSSNDGAAWSSQGSIFTFNPGVNNWAVRYQANVMIAFGYNGGDSIRYYRKATLNADGSVSWNAAEVAIGAADATSTELNALIANGKPIMWRAGPNNGDPGRFTIGDQLDSPVIWTDTPNAPSLGPASIPGNGSDGRFSAGAIFAAGGADPDDLIVLRATTGSTATLGSHRLVSMKYDASLNTFDSEWYNVSTLGSTLTEDNSTEVGVTATDEEAHRRFAAVVDSSGNIHAVYKNQLSDIVHYKKDPGFNDTWTRLGTDILGANGSKVALTAAASDNLFLYFETTAVPNVLQSQRFDGAAWGGASTLFSGTDLQKSFGAMERFGSCAPAVAFTHGNGSPFDVNFSLDAGACAPLITSEGSGRITVTAPGSFEMTFDTAAGGSIERFYDLAEDPGKTTDLAGGTNPEGLHNFGIRSGTNYNTTTDAVSASIHLLEATPTRVRVRQESGYENNNTGNLLAGVRGVGTYSVYPSGRLALNHQRFAYVSVPYQNEYSELVAHYTDGAPPLDTWASYYELAGAGVGTGNDGFTLSQSDVADARTDFLQILAENWVVGPKHQASATLTDRTFSIPADRLNAYWYEGGGGNILAGAVDTWDSLTYFKPTSFIDHNDANVISRASDYRAPDDISGGDFAAGSRWDEDGNNDGFNESEAAYTLEFDPTTGLTFDMDGSGTTRYSPFMKIRQWRSPHDPIVTLETVPLTNDVDFRADVKPISDADFANTMLLHTTLQNFAAVTAPDIGDGTGASQASVSYVGARYGSGVEFDPLGSGDHVSIPVIAGGAQNIELDRGTIEFWYKPNYNYDDNVQHYLLDIEADGAAGGSRIRIKKESDVSSPGKPNWLNIWFADSAGTYQGIEIPDTNYAWRAGEWLHFKLRWNSAGASDNVRLTLNGVGLTPQFPRNNTFTMGAETASGLIRIGNEALSAGFVADGVFDELTVYGVFGTTQLAYGGLKSNGSEALASTTNNRALTFVTVDAARRGRYLFLGSDAQFRGLNVSLATAGVGTAQLQWEFWNGTAWIDLEVVGGFTDETAELTQDGTVYWGADPPGWSTYSVGGSPDLFYVRAHTVSGSYSTFPVEALIKTDILLFQYCGDINLSARTFDFAVPVPTAVELASFDARGLDGVVELRWETASELDNLGFHVYRAATLDGVYERITATPIPGLGSSPVGARYSYRDAGLANDTTYYYQLEDIETTGKTKRHGPVHATAGTDIAAEPTTSSQEDGDSGARMTFGEPEASTFRVVPRRNGLVLELVTNGFVAVAQSDGTVRLEVPGLEEVDGSSLPVKRAWVEAIAGRDVELVSVRARGVSRFDGLRPGAALVPEVVASPRGTVRARRARRGRRNERTDGARLVETGYQGESKKALVELSPFTWDSGGLELARTLEVHVAFRGREAVARTVRRAGHGIATRLATVERGLYAVTLDDVVGRRRARSASALRLSRQGEAVPHHVEHGVVYFWSEGAAVNPYGSEAVYELELDVIGETMDVFDRSTTASYYSERLEREENRIYQAGLVEAPDVWLWDVLFAPQTKSFDFEVRDLASAAELAKLEVWLQGTSDVANVDDHHVRVSVNGTFVGEGHWDGKTAHKLEAELGLGVLRDGVNTLEIENVGDTGASFSMVMLDRYRVVYPRNASVLERAAYVIDVTDTPRWVTSGVDAARSYVAVDEPLRPELRRVPKSKLTKRHRAEYLVIGPKALLEAAAPLVQHRRRQGLVVKTASTEAITSAFGHGELSPESIRALIAYAYHEWRAPKLRYVVLLGDATYDFKDYLGTGVDNQVPPYLVRTSYLWTASDPAYAAVNGDDLLPDVSIGRLPARSAEELRAMVAKILAYERGERSTDAPFVLVADDADHAGDFEQDAEEIASTLLAGRETTRIYLSEMRAPAARDAIAASFDAGAATMSYLGHGAIHLWADENVFNASRVDDLSPQANQPLLFTMNCLNGYFHFPYFDSLAEALLKQETKGAIAAFSPSGLSLNDPAHRYHKALLRELLDGGHPRLGDAVLEAQRSYADSGAFPELLSIYHLFGDPAIPLR